jgi:hypothetical protein
MGAMHILDKAYKGVDLVPLPANRAVVAGSNPGEAKLPANANDGLILGITVGDQATSDGFVAIRKAGIALVEAGGAISAGEPLNIAGTSGRVKAISETSGTAINCIGFAESDASVAGDLVEVFISIHERTAP